MKRIFTLFFALVMVSEAFAQQVYYNWDFTTLTTSSFPAGFVTWNLDGQSVDPNYLNSSLNSGWVEFPYSAQNGPGVAAVASLFTNTTIACNRWLVTAPMTIPMGVPNVCLQWVAASAGPSNGFSPENYTVEVSTTDSATTSFTTLTTITGENGSNTTRILPLASYAGQTIRIAIRDITVNGFVLLLNSIKLVNLPSQAISVSDVEIYEHNYTNNPITVGGQFTNTGLNTITSFTMNYSVNGGAAVSVPQTGANLTAQTGYFYTHPTPFTPTTAGTQTVSVWFSALNGTGSTSDTASVTIFAYPQVAGLTKNVLVEEMTGAGCPWCSGGALTLRDDYNNHSGYVIPVAIHSGDINDLSTTPADALQITDGETVCNYLATGFPTAMVDRQFYFDNQSVATNVQTTDGQYGTYQGTTANGFTYIWDTLSVFRYHQATPVNVTLSGITFDSTSTSNNLSVTVNANFLNSLSQGSYNINFYVVEDSVLTPAGNTTGAGYNQDNGNYSGYTQSGHSELLGLAAVLTDNGQPNEWAQNHVLRLMAGGPWGTGSIIPSAPVAGTTYSQTYTVSVPAGWRYNYINLVGLVQEYNADANKRTVLNSVKVPLISFPAGIVETKEFSSLSVYPNPASSVATVLMNSKENATATISVLNAVGQEVIAPANVVLNSGSQSYEIQVGNLSTGLYLVKVSVNGEISTLPLSVNTK